METITHRTGHWEHFRHGADIGVRGWGPSLARSLEQAAVAMTAVITDPECVEPKEAVLLQCQAPTPELMLYDWLNALILEMATRQMLFGRFEVRIDGEHLIGRAFGERISQARHQPAVEIKGATMTELAVDKAGPGIWRAQCVVDV